MQPENTHVAVREDPHGLALDLVLSSTRLVRSVSSMLDIPLSLAQSWALATLRDEGPLRVSLLARQQRCSQPSMTTLVDRMESAGLVRRTTDPLDGRAVLVGATPAGLEMLESAAAAIADTLARTLERLPAGELADLERGLAVVRHITDDVRAARSATHA